MGERAVHDVASRDHVLAELAEGFALLQQRGTPLRKVVQAVRPSVVHIEAAKQTGGGNLETSDSVVEEAGSGVIIDLNGRNYIVTNRHVVKDAQLDGIRIHLEDGRILQPVKVWADRTTDVAVVSIDAERLIPARLGDSSQVEIGDFVLAMGSPFGLSHSVTHGIISAKGRRDLQLGTEEVRIQDFLQTDAAINPGNSGGPLINLLGEVVGLNTAIASNSGGNEGIGFSIPINMAVHVARQLVENGHLVRAYLGVQLDSQFEAADAAKLGLPRLVGSRVLSVSKDSPAEDGEIQVADVILAFDGIPVEDDSHLINLVGLTPVGAEVPLVVWRDGRSLTLVVTLRARD
jgi:serine protease Do